MAKNIKGGTILGKGSFGCVIDPPIVCEDEINAINKVSKIINITGMKESRYKELKKEYEIGKKFTNIDPKNDHFLPGIAMCEITKKDIKTKQNKKDIKKCNYNGRNLKLLNIIMKKGKDFYRITKNMNENVSLKSFLYLLHGANTCINKLNTCLVDIKYENLLYTSPDNNQDLIYPVFIDFSPFFVIRSEKDFMDFIEKFGYRIGYIYPIEFNSLYYILHYNSINKPKQNRFKTELKKKKNIDLNKKNDLDNFLYHGEYLKDLLDNKKIDEVFNLTMIYLIGLSFFDTFVNKDNFKKYNFLQEICQLTTYNIYERPYIQDVIEIIEKKIKIKNSSEKLEKLYIKLIDKSDKKKVKKTNKIFNFFKKKIKGGKKTKNINNIKKNKNFKKLNKKSNDEHLKKLIKQSKKRNRKELL